MYRQVGRGAIVKYLRIGVAAVGIAGLVLTGTAGCAPSTPQTGSGSQPARQSTTQSASPAPQSAPRPSGKMMAGSAWLTDADNGGTADLIVGGTLIVDLEENATTGFRWQVDDALPGVLEAAGDESQASVETSLVGAPGRRILSYQSVKAGQADLKLVYVRSWEKGVAPEKTFTVHVVVN
jgi:inhibitor of cysteine peptidase